MPLLLVRIMGLGDLNTFIIWGTLVFPACALLLDCSLLPLLAARLSVLCLLAHQPSPASLPLPLSGGYAARVLLERWSPSVFLLAYVGIAGAAWVPEYLRATLRELREGRYLLRKTLLNRESVGAQVHGGRRSQIVAAGGEG